MWSCMYRIFDSAWTRRTDGLSSQPDEGPVQADSRRPGLAFQVESRAGSRNSHPTATDQYASPAGTETTAVCTENLNADVMVTKSVEDWSELNIYRARLQRGRALASAAKVNSSREETTNKGGYLLAASSVYGLFVSLPICSEMQVERRLPLRKFTARIDEGLTSGARSRGAFTPIIPTVIETDRCLPSRAFRLM